MIFAIILIVVLASFDLMFFYAMGMTGMGLGYFLIISGWFNTFIIGIFWLIDNLFLTPSESKTLKKCKNEKRIPVIMEADNGLLLIDYEVSSTPEGGIITKNNGPMFVPRSIVANIDNQEEAEALTEIHPVVAKRSFLPGVGMPCWAGYQGKGILTNFRTAAELQYGLAGATSNPTSSQTEKVNTGEGTKEVKVFWPVSLTKLKSHFPKSWNIAAIRALEKRAEQVGFLKGKKGNRMEKMWVLLLIAGCLFVGVLGVVLFFLKG